MSSSEYGVADIQDAAIGWVEANPNVTAILGDGGDVIPVQIASESDADPRVSIGASVSTASRMNDFDESTFEVRAVVDSSVGYVRENGSLEVTTLKDRVTDTLTEHRAGFYDPEVSNDDEIAYTDALNRYLGVVAVTIPRRDTRTTT